MSIMVPTDFVMGSFIEKLYQQLGGGEAKVMDDPNSFIAFIPGGQVVDPKQFVFAGDVAHYVLGVGDEFGRPLQNVKPEDRTPEAQAERQKQVYRNELRWSQLVNCHPATDGMRAAAESKRNVCLYKPEGETLWNTYAAILDQMEVPALELTAEQKARVQKVYDFLQVNAPLKNAFGEVQLDQDGKPIMEAQPSPQKLAYTKYMDAYVDAFSEYAGLMASQSSSAADAQKWNVLGSTLRKRVSAALNNWDVEGHRLAVEGAAAYVDNVNAGAMDLILKNLRDAMKSPRQVDDDAYFNTMMLSNAFAAGSDGWTQQSFYENDYKSLSKQSSSKWGGQVGLSLGMFGANAKAQGSSFNNSTQIDTENFSMRYKLTQVQLLRSWFHPQFLRSKSWRFKDGFKGNMVSDAAVPPQGLLTAYTTSAIFVRDVFISFSNASSFQQDIGSSVSGGGSVGWGPFSVSANYGQDDGSQEARAHRKGQGIYIPGMQLIGFVCKLLPKSPDTAPGVFK
jgi:hypothetical protein